MSGPDNFHSHLVGWSKILLPMAALGLLSTLFLLARDNGEPAEISFAEIIAMAREQRVTAPRFSGITDRGANLAIMARTATPDLNRADIVNFDRMEMRMDNADGSSLDVTASFGEVDGNTRIAKFLGLARVETSSGYEMETNGLIAELDTGTVTSDGKLEVRGPLGTLTAGQVVFHVTDTDSGQQMLFTQGVRLIYQPQG